MHGRTLAVLAVLAVAACPWRIASAEKARPAAVGPQRTTGEPNGQRRPPPKGRSGLTGYVAAEGRLFFHDPLYAGQEDNNGSLAAQPEYYYQWNNGALFTFTPFARVDSVDSERTHWDIRELYYHYTQDWWSVRFGMARVFGAQPSSCTSSTSSPAASSNTSTRDKLGQPSSSSPPE
jgi:hypothetical protein